LPQRPQSFGFALSYIFYITPHCPSVRPRPGLYMVIFSPSQQSHLAFFPPFGLFSPYGGVVCYLFLKFFYSIYQCVLFCTFYSGDVVHQWRCWRPTKLFALDPVGHNLDFFLCPYLLLSVLLAYQNILPYSVRCQGRFSA